MILVIFFACSESMPCFSVPLILKVLPEAAGSPASKAFNEMSRRDQLLLEHAQAGLRTLFRVGGDHDHLVARPRDSGVGAAEVVPLRHLLGGLVESVVDFLPVDLADHVER